MNLHQQVEIRMGLKLESVVPWGRSMTEYVRMFHLQASDLNLKIIDCASGPASFNTQMTSLGYQVVSCDPVYELSANEIARRIQETYSLIINGVEKNQHNYLWIEIESPAKLGEIRVEAMSQFLADFPLGLEEKRYLTDGLPKLPFAANQFDLALCSHFLFTYSDHFSAEFHVEAIAEMCRVAKEARIFPLLNISGEPSLLLHPVLSELQNQGYRAELKQVPYEFQRGGNLLLRVCQAT